jgi:hypothetical protein
VALESYEQKLKSVQLGRAVDWVGWNADANIPRGAENMGGKKNKLDFI